MPLAYGGGINSFEHVNKIFRIGVEKIIFNTAALDNIEFVSDVIKSVGSQSVIISIDIKKTSSVDIKSTHTKRASV